MQPPRVVFSWCLRHGERWDEHFVDEVYDPVACPVPLFALMPVYERLLILGTLCQFSFDRAKHSLETLDDVDHLEWIGDPIVLLLSHICF